MRESETDCETCGGDRVLIGDKADHKGERTDDVQPCPDCGPERDEDTGTFNRDEGVDFFERRFDYGGEA